MDSYSPALPSQSALLFKSFLGKRLLSMRRYSLSPKDVAAVEGGIPFSRVFERTEGPLALTFEDGRVLGMAGDDSLNSVIVWLDRDEAGDPDFHPMDEDVDIFPVDSSDPIFSIAYWNAFVGDFLLGLSIIKENPVNPRLESRPCEVGLCLHWKKNGKFVVADGLGNGSLNFGLMSWDAVQPKLGSRFYEIHLL